MAALAHSLSRRAFADQDFAVTGSPVPVYSPAASSKMKGWISSATDPGDLQQRMLGGLSACGRSFSGSTGTAYSSRKGWCILLSGIISIIAESVNRSVSLVAIEVQAPRIAILSEGQHLM